jgi:hypothetical protein
MQGETSERWKALCKQASKEKDSKKLSELLDEIYRLLDGKLSQPNQ